MNSANVRIVVGANWGDEGKGRMVDYFAQSADVVGRYQGGNNAGHTVINDLGEFKLHLLPSGVFNPNAVNVLGPGMVIDLAGLISELEQLKRLGLTPRVAISDRATLVLPIHKLEDIWEEARLGDQAFGSTRNGIAYAYADRYAKKALQVGCLKDPALLARQLRTWYDWKVPMLRGLYGDVLCPSYEELLADLLTQAETLKNLIVNISALSQGFKEGSNIVLEAQLGSLRDLHFGNYPYTTSSSVLASAAELGSGLFFNEKPMVTAVIKAFSSSVGNGPFPTAMENMDALRESATEFGATTGRPRDVGYFDAFATAYGVQLQNADEAALTKLDCLSGYSELKICTGYERNGTVLEHYPLAEELFEVTPIYETLTGWSEDITDAKTFKDLPEAAQTYVLFIENFVQCPINYVSVGPHRDQLILRS